MSKVVETHWNLPFRDISTLRRRPVRPRLQLEPLQLKSFPEGRGRRPVLLAPARARHLWHHRRCQDRASPRSDAPPPGSSVTFKHEELRQLLVRAKNCNKMLIGRTWKNMEEHGRTWKNMEEHGRTIRMLWKMLEALQTFWSRLKLKESGSANMANLNGNDETMLTGKMWELKDCHAKMQRQSCQIVGRTWTYVYNAKSAHWRLDAYHIS